MYDWKKLGNNTKDDTKDKKYGSSTCVLPMYTWTPKYKLIPYFVIMWSPYF